MSTSTNDVPQIELRDGVNIPQVGFGVFQVPPEDTAEVVSKALNTGYRHIDTAAAYRNERGVGEAIAGSGIPREEIFVTTKCWNSDHGRAEARRALEQSLDRLGLEQVDLYLIHWPAPDQDRYVETWQAFIEAQQEGLARAIGVSNFKRDHLHRIIDETGVVPSVNQIELHPRLQQPEMRSVHEELGIATEAWSPLAQAQVLEDEVIAGISREHDRTPAQVVLRWHLQLGNIVIPKSVTPKRIEQNLELFDFELTAEEMRAIESLELEERTGPDPDTFG